MCTVFLFSVQGDTPRKNIDVFRLLWAWELEKIVDTDAPLPFVDSKISRLFSLEVGGGRRRRRKGSKSNLTKALRCNVRIS